MAKKSTIISNWAKYLLQWGVLAALVIFLTGIIPSKEPVDPEAYCPVGGLQALTTWLASGSLPCSMTTMQIMMGIALAASVVLLSKLFCGYICPLGTVQDLLTKLRNSLGIKGIEIRQGSFADSALRLVKYILLFWIFYMTATASELFCKNLDPYYAVATGFKGEITLWMSIVTICLLVIGGFFIKMFWCKYLCPLGAVSNSLKFWIWIAGLFLLYYVLGLVGLNIPWWILLGAFCLAGYLLEILNRRPKYQIINVIKDENLCTHCGICNKKCPYSIDIKSLGDGRINQVDCTACGECVAACPTEALRIGICKNSKSGFWKVGTAVVAAVFVALGIWAGSKFELPTIDVTWGIEETLEDGTVRTLVDPSSLATMKMEGLRSVKCYGSSMAFKARLEKIPGIHGVKTYVGSHTVVITYDPSKITPEQIQERIYVPSNFRINTPDHNALDSLKIVTIRTEKMYDKLDLNYLGLQFRQTGKKLYGLESEFACPLIVRVYMDPSEEVDEKWFKEIVEKDELDMPVHGGGSKPIEMDIEFVGMEDGVSYIKTTDFLEKMFSGFKAEFKSRVEEYEGKPQFVYELVDPDYEKPIIRRYMPYLSNHLSKHEGIIGIYLVLNKDYIPAIRIRYAAPMTAEKVWELMTMPQWTITYKKDDVRTMDAPIGFEKEGVEYPYETQAQ